MTSADIITGDALTVLRGMEAGMWSPEECGCRPVSAHWLLTSCVDPIIAAAYDAHYTAWKRNGRPRRAMRPVGPGQEMCLVTPNADAAWVWRLCRYRLDGQFGVECSLFRNTGNVLSSVLVREASDCGNAKWPEMRQFTYVDGARIRSSNPGCCFRKAGWTRCGTSARGLLIFEYADMARRRIANAQPGLGL